MTKAEQLEIMWKSATKTTCFADLAKRIDPYHTRTFSDGGPRWTEYHFSDGSSIRAYGRGKYHHYEVFATRRQARA